jgi:3-oxoacyl-[acyl-carrier protein] reductase
MDLKLDGKIALVTGSSRGIGHGIARQLALEGCKVVLNSRNSDELKHATSNINGSLGFQGDTSDLATCEEIVSKTVNKMGGLDILICNVGFSFGLNADIEETNAWTKALELNLFPTVNIVSAAFSELKKSHGSIICISSICGIEPIGCPIPYSVSKSAVESFVKNSAPRFGKHGIRINSVAPGNILFEGSVWEQKIKLNKAKVETMLTDHVPMQRFGSVSDIAKATAFLASPESGFITGATLVVDGGQTRT